MDKVILDELTIIIPVYIESLDRYNNARNVLGYLNHHLSTNVIIHEIIDSESKLDFLDEFDSLRIKHIVEVRNNNNYHRTRQLNEMLNLVETAVVSNYDIDVILPIESYTKSCDMIVSGISDVVYPYGNGVYQMRVPQNFDMFRFRENYDISEMVRNTSGIIEWNAVCGHCIFINTDKYKECGAENENFVAYGPEDVERYERFQRFGYKVDRVEDYIYHFEHHRTEFSSHMNRDFINNERLFNYIRGLSEDEVKSYYKEIEYIKKYNFK